MENAGFRPANYPETRPFSEKFTDEHIKKYGPAREAEEFTTVKRVYETPFVYKNLEVGNFAEFGMEKGIEFCANDGYITITEERPIVAVTVVGSGCVRSGFNIVEWWDEGEGLDDIKSQLVKRQRAENLNGMHPSFWLCTLLANNIDDKDAHLEWGSRGSTASVNDMIKKLTWNFYENLQFSLYENTAFFRIGTTGNYPKKITIRSGCNETEDPGMSFAYYPGDYVIRLIEVTVIDKMIKAVPGFDWK